MPPSKHSVKCGKFFKKYCHKSLSSMPPGPPDLVKLASTLSYRASVLRALYDANGKPCGFNGKTVEKSRARKKAEAILQQALAIVARKPRAFTSQKAFDDWAVEQWEAIRQQYHNQGITWYTYGNAQKWFNMAIKYYAVMSIHFKHANIGDFDFCHFPVDGQMIRIIEKDKKIGFAGNSWSKCDDKMVFLNYIQDVRNQIVPESLFKYELRNW